MIIEEDVTQLCEAHAHYMKLAREAEERMESAGVMRDWDRYADAVYALNFARGQADVFFRRIADAISMSMSR